MLAMLLAAMSPAAADQVRFVDARDVDGRLDVQARDHHVRYLTWDAAPHAPDDHREMSAEERVGFSIRNGHPATMSFTVHAPRPGDYRLTLRKLFVHSADAGGRHLAVQLVPESKPRVIVTRSLPDRDSMAPHDVTLDLPLSSQVIRDGRVTIMLRAATVGGCNLEGVELTGSESSDAFAFVTAVDPDGRLTASGRARNVRYRLAPAADDRMQPWNLGASGAGLGTSAAYGHLVLKLACDGAGPHRLMLHDVMIPQGVLPGLTILRVNGNRVISGAGKHEILSVPIDVGSGDVERGAIDVRIDPALEQVVFVKAVSLEAAGALRRYAKPAEIDRCVLWPLPSYSGFRPSMLPPEPEPEALIAMDGARGEWVHACWMAGNYRKNGPDPMRVRFDLSDLRVPGGATIAAKSVRIQVLVPVRAGLGHAGTVWQGLKDQGIVDVPSGEARQMWMVTRIPRSAVAGPYTGSLQASWPGGQKTFRVELRVRDFTLPDRSPLAVCGWLQFYQGPGISEGFEDEIAEPLLADYADHYFNVLLTGAGSGLQLMVVSDTGWDEKGRLARALNPIRVRRAVDAFARHRMRHLLFYGGAWKLMREPHHWEATRSSPPLAQSDPAFIHVARKVLDSITVTCEKAGLEHDDWAVYPFDEYLGPGFLTEGRTTRAARPKVRIYSNHSADLGQMRAAAPYVDIWCPYLGQITSTGGEERMAFMRSTDKPIWCYSASGYRGVDALHYRSLGWFAFHHDLDGTGTWNYYGGFSGLVGDAVELTDAELDENDYPQIRASRGFSQVSRHADGYTAKHGPLIWSPRLFAFADGIEDHMVLAMLADHCRENPRAPSAARIRGLLDEATAEVMSSGSAIVHRKWAARLRDAFESLRHP